MQNIEKQTEIKIRLEALLRKQLATLFSRVLSDFRLAILRPGPTSFDAAKYRSGFNTLLQEHYIRVQNRFKGAVVREMREMKAYDKEKVEALIALAAWRDNKADEISGKLTDTTQSNMDAAYRDALDLLLGESEEGGGAITPVDLAALATTMLKRKLSARKNVIAATETQAAAESTKLIEVTAALGVTAQTISSMLSGGARPPKEQSAIKQWVTVGDTLVRPAHKAADGQTVYSNAPFIVKNQQLMYPGDMESGATLDNVILCRCAARYILPQQF